MKLDTNHSEDIPSKCIIQSWGILALRAGVGAAVTEATVASTAVTTVYRLM